MTIASETIVRGRTKDTEPEWLIPGLVPARGIVLVRDYGADLVARRIRLALAEAGHQSAIASPLYPTPDVIATALEVGAAMTAIMVAGPWWSEAEIAVAAKVAAVVVECAADAFKVGDRHYISVPEVKRRNTVLRPSAIVKE